MKDATARRLSSAHRRLFHTTRGLIGRRLVNNDVLLLSTTGRRTGDTHPVPLLYLCDGETPVVIASWGGRPTHPEWYLNLIAEPRVEVQIRLRSFAALARPMNEPKRTRWWQQAVTAYDGYAEYQTRTDRIIPIVRLTPS